MAASVPTYSGAGRMTIAAGATINLQMGSSLYEITNNGDKQTTFESSIDPTYGHTFKNGFISSVNQFMSLPNDVYRYPYSNGR